MKKIKDFITIILFCAIVVGFCTAGIIESDKDVSYSERRKLKSFGEVLNTSVLSKDFSTELENYLLDQMSLREIFRKINDRVRYNVMQQSDVNGLWTEDGSLFKNDDKLNKEQVLYGTKLINKLCEQKLGGMNVYYSIIPDKNYFIRDKAPWLKLDYNELFNLLGENIKGAQYIDITDTLSLSDYYKTDTHWSQPKIYETAKKLAEGMNMAHLLTQESDYKLNTKEPFYGVYWGQAALGTKPDKLEYLTNDYTQNAKVYGIDKEILKNEFGVNDTLENKVYALDKFEGMDAYDMFLSGAQPIVTIESENARSDRELIIFRDSFSSSLAPLFTGAYKKITLIDLRYIPSMLLDRFVEFKDGEDVLFLYSTSLYNSAMLLK